MAAIIGDERTMFNLMKKELREVKKLFGNPRRSELQDTAKTIEIDTASLIVEEETFVSVTVLDIIKRTRLVLSMPQHWKKSVSGTTMS